MNLETARDRIYEAAILPDRWPGVLDSIAEIAGAVGSLLIADDTRDPVWVNSPSLDGFLHDFMEGEWGRVDSRMPKVLAANHDGFLLEEDVFTADELARDPLIQGFLRPRGFGWATATFMPQAGGGNLILSIERRFADGPVPRAAVETLDGLRADLARSARLAAQHGLGRGRATIDGFADFGIPAGVIARNGRLTVVNEKLAPLMPEVVRDGRERVAFAESNADKLLSELLASERRELSCSIPIRQRAQQPAYVAHLIPVRGAVNDIFAGGLTILTLTPVVGGSGPDPSILRALFDLTPAEARVLKALAAGDSLAQIAGAGQISVETVRSQLKGLFNKTETQRQVDLVRLVAGLNSRNSGPGSLP